MKLLLLVPFIISHLYAFENHVDITIGQAQFKGDTVSTQAISYHFLKDVYKFAGAELKIGLGARWTSIQASEFAIYKQEETVEDVALNAMNIALYTEADFGSWIAGFNIDLIGQTSGDASSINGEDQDPASFNMLRGAENDEGTLNSEFWVGKKFGDLKLRGGLAHIVIQYDGDNPDNEKRQRFFDAFFLSVGWGF